MNINPEIIPRHDEEVADLLRRAAREIQAMTDRMLAQCKRSRRGESADAYSLTGLKGT